jgi:hypothetical protein
MNADFYIFLCILIRSLLRTLNEAIAKHHDFIGFSGKNVSKASSKNSLKVFQIKKKINKQNITFN